MTVSTPKVTFAFSTQNPLAGPARALQVRAKSRHGEPGRTSRSEAADAGRQPVRPRGENRSTCSAAFVCIQMMHGHTVALVVIQRRCTAQLAAAEVDVVMYRALFELPSNLVRDPGRAGDFKSADLATPEAWLRAGAAALREGGSPPRSLHRLVAPIVL